MNKKKLAIYNENIKKLKCESLKSLANSGHIFELSDEREKKELINACKIEGINCDGYQDNFKKSALPVFISVATWDYQLFFLIHSTNFETVRMEMDSVITFAIRKINELQKLKNEMECVLQHLNTTDVAYSYPNNCICYDNEKIPDIIPYPEDYPIL